jgi:hypothetical protein
LADICASQNALTASSSPDSRVKIGCRAIQQIQLATIADALLSAAQIEQEIICAEAFRDWQMQLLQFNAQAARLVGKIGANVESVITTSIPVS